MRKAPDATVFVGSRALPKGSVSPVLMGPLLFSRPVRRPWI